MAAGIRVKFNAPNRKAAELFLQEAIQIYALSVPRLSAWMEENLAEGFTVFDSPLEHRRSIRTTNSLERINKEIRTRTRVVGVFPNEATCLRLISSLLMEISEEWQIGKHYCTGKSINWQRYMVISGSNLQKEGCVIGKFRTRILQASDLNNSINRVQIFNFIIQQASTQKVTVTDQRYMDQQEELEIGLNYCVARFYGPYLT